MYIAVAVDVPLHQAFTYRCTIALRPGVRVLVPYRTSVRTGLVVEVDVSPPANFPPSRIREIVDVLDTRPVVPPAQLELVKWLARYYHAPIGEAVRLALPAGLAVDGKTVVKRTESERPTELDPLLGAILDRLDADPVPASPRDLIKGIEDARHSHLGDLEAAGLVVFALDEAKTAGSRRIIDRVSLLALSDGKRMGPRQKEVLDFLEEHGDSDSDELRRLYGTQRGELRRLAERGLVELTPEEVIRDPFAKSKPLPRTSDPVLTDEQTHALAEIRSALASNESRAILLHGVTGSGKTEVYLRAIREVVASGGRALVLLPEIALTPQFVSVFRSALGECVAVQHSGLTPAQRYDQWRVIRDGRVPVVIGARSAIFAPIEDLRLIVVDEEHDSSFKQDTGVTYNARDLAVVMSGKVGATLVLGSATPSLESTRNAEQGRYTLCTMRQRANRKPLPIMEMVDLRDHPPDPASPLGRYLSAPLQAALNDTVSAGEQAILFLNRRGYAPLVQCTDCGTSFECPNCDISLTYHRRGHSAQCHYCGHTMRVPDTCPTCGGEDLLPLGIGTEQLESLIQEGFPQIRTARLDADTARGAGLLRVLDRFRSGQADVLIGTQMVTKGHDFPRVTLVGVINADQSLRFPDFRSGERTFQLLAQVGGRAGRADQAGRVIVQTWDPDHVVLQAAKAHNYEQFATRELHFRQRTLYPPFGYMALIRVSGLDYQVTWRAADRLADYASTHGPDPLRVLGPVDAPIARINERYRIQIALRSTKRGAIHRGVALILHRQHAGELAPSRNQLRVLVDIDPLTML